MIAFLARLDAYGMDDPDNNEAHRTDRCNVCEWPMIDHRPWPPRRGQHVAWRAKWPHRRAAFRAILFDLDGCADLYSPQYPLKPSMRQYLVQKARVIFGRG